MNSKEGKRSEVTGQLIFLWPEVNMEEICAKTYIYSVWIKHVTQLKCIVILLMSRLSSENYKFLHNVIWWYSFTLLCTSYQFSHPQSFSFNRHYYFNFSYYKTEYIFILKYKQHFHVISFHWMPYTCLIRYVWEVTSWWSTYKQIFKWVHVKQNIRDITLLQTM